MDMTKAIEPRSDQLNAEDLLTGPRTFTITDVREGSSEQRVRVFLAEGPEGRPYLPNVTMCRLMVLAWGPESDNYIGKRLTLYRDPEVRFGRDQPGGIRISHMSGIDRPIVANLAITKGKRGPYRVEPLPDDAPTPTLMDQLVWAMNAAKIEGKEARLAFCRDVIGRDIGNANELTAQEISAVIEALRSASLPPEGHPAREALDNPSPREELVGRPVRSEPSDEELALAYEREMEANGNG